MISFFRKALSSWIVLGLFGFLLVSFAVTGFGSGGIGGLGQLAGGGDTVAKIGSDSLSATMVERRIKAQFDLARQQKPDLSLAEFLGQGAYDAILKELIDRQAVLAFAEKNRLVISDRLVDSELAKNSQFDDNTGKFDRDTYERAVAGMGTDTKSFEASLRSDLLYRQLAIPAGWKVTLPLQLVTPYANLLEEK
ncbi:MAG: hypothetical protein RL367_840, partial [Pseudomonadota bacterium]